MQCCISLSLSDAINSLLITYQAVSVFHLTRQLVYILLIHTDIASTSLAAGQTTSWIQDGQLGIPSAVKQSTYLSSDDIHLTSENSACSLRSSSERKCSVTRVHSRFGDICLAAAGPRKWNNLPASLRDKEVSCTEFRKQKIGLVKLVKLLWPLGQSNLTKSASRGPIPRLRVTPEGRNLYHWIPGVGVPISVP